jgi:hypothetical protein
LLKEALVDEANRGRYVDGDDLDDIEIGFGLKSMRRLVKSVQEIDGELEVRCAHLPLCGPLESEDGTWYVVIGEPLICTKRPTDDWRIEFSDGGGKAGNRGGHRCFDE